jgi:hypothetical protein
MIPCLSSENWPYSSKYANYYHIIILSSLSPLVLVLGFISCSKLSIQGQNRQIQNLSYNKACYNKQAVILEDIYNITHSYTFINLHTTCIWILNLQI